MGWDSAGLPVYTRYTNKEKLPSHINHYGIQDMYKDDQGFLWLATVGLGLQRLNIATGEIKSYKHDPDDPYSISHNMISSICEDDSGNLWIGTGFIQFKTGGGLNKFDRKTEQFTNYRHNLNNPFSLSSDIIKDVFIDRNNNLWVGVSDEGLFSVPLH
jgi:ligand-binding sensor domain-containing protein